MKRKLSNNKLNNPNIFNNFNKKYKLTHYNLNYDINTIQMDIDSIKKQLNNINNNIIKLLKKK